MHTQRSNRIERISQEIKKKISIILQHKINDPRIGMPTISGISVSKDLRNAIIFITFLDKNSLEEIHAAIMVLQRASRFIRCLLAKNIHLRIVPVLFFKYDPSLIEGAKIYNLVTGITISD